MDSADTLHVGSDPEKVISLTEKPKVKEAKTCVILITLVLGKHCFLNTKEKNIVVTALF